MHSSTRCQRLQCHSDPLLSVQTDPGNLLTNTIPVDLTTLIPVLNESGEKSSISSFDDRQWIEIVFAAQYLNRKSCM